MGAEIRFVDPNEHRGRNALIVGLALAAFYGLMALIALNNQDSPLSVVLTMPALCLYGFLMLPQVGWGYLAGAVFWFLLGGGWHTSPAGRGWCWPACWACGPGWQCWATPFYWAWPVRLDLGGEGDGHHRPHPQVIYSPKPK